MDGLVQSWRRRSLHGSGGGGSPGEGAPHHRERRGSVGSILDAPGGLLSAAAAVAEASAPRSAASGQPMLDSVLAQPPRRGVGSADPWRIRVRPEPASDANGGGGSDDFAAWLAAVARCANSGAIGAVSAAPGAARGAARARAEADAARTRARRDAAAAQGARKRALMLGTLRLAASTKPPPPPVMAATQPRRARSCAAGGSRRGGGPTPRPVLVDDDDEGGTGSHRATASAAARRARPGALSVDVGSTYPGYRDHTPWSHAFRDRHVDAELYGGRFAV